ncbi:4'-phosphopantetheinyl transferase family protein [Lysobacter tyrosinilyticus]
MDCSISPVAQESEATHLRGPWPDHLHFAALHYAYSEETLRKLECEGIALPDEIRRAVLKRRIDFAAGRLCARQALQAAGCSLPIDVPIDANRAPVWPGGYIASITHCDGLAMALAASRDEVGGLGLDLERLISSEVSKEIQAHVASPSEVALGRMHGMPIETWMTLLFSAKESLYKALHPSVGRFFDFSEAEADDLDVDAGALHLRLLTALSSECREGMRYRISFQFPEGRVLTCCVVPTLPRPTP